MGYEDIIGATDIFGAQATHGGQSMFGSNYGTYRGVTLVGAEDAMVPGLQSQQGQLSPPGFVQQVALRRAAGVSEREYTKARVYPLGFGITTIKAGATQVIPVVCQVPFRGNRLTIPSDIAGAVVINDIKVGQASQFAAGGAVPGRAYTEFATYSELNLDTAQIGQTIFLSITNTSSADIEFTAELKGTVVL
jgi:hypothetical protein